MHNSFIKKDRIVRNISEYDRGETKEDTGKKCQRLLTEQERDAPQRTKNMAAAPTMNWNLCQAHTRRLRIMAIDSSCVIVVR